MSVKEYFDWKAEERQRADREQARYEEDRFIERLVRALRESKPQPLDRGITVNVQLVERVEERRFSVFDERNPIVKRAHERWYYLLQQQHGPSLKSEYRWDEKTQEHVTIVRYWVPALEPTRSHWCGLGLEVIG